MSMSSASSRPRPRSINELATIAREQPYESNRPLKYYLRFADKFRNDAMALFQDKEYEEAFINFAKAATLVFEIIPGHPEFKTRLTPTQRDNLDSNGKNVLDHLGIIKPALVDRYERWRQRHPEEAALIDSGQEVRGAPPPARAIRDPPPDPEIRRASESRHSGETSRARSVPPENRRQHDQRQEEMRRRQEEIARRQNEAREREGIFRRQEEAERAAQAARRQATPEPSPYETLPYQPMPRPPISPYSASAGKYGVPPPQQQPQQHLAPTSALPTPAYTPAASSNSTPTHSQTSPTRTSPYSNPPPSHLPTPPNNPPLHTPQAISHNSSSSSFMELRMPLEYPSVYDGESTDSESVHMPRRSGSILRQPLRSPSYPPPMTTTSPPPVDTRISYPTIMSHHQQTQGYTPSSHSMFKGSQQQLPGSQQMFFGAGTTRPLYSADSLPRPSVTQVPSNGSHRSSHSISQQSSRPPEPLPPRPGELKTVTLPRDSLTRFLSIARINTSLNKETCGLLLGKDKGHKYVVTTLLVPKQHSTSDTCTMDEEELVLSFTVERNLITLGWIHTHPSQSCFMSSLDLHTHASFQRMLPESFAVVCAPKSTPNFGIFRLTDPPGLDTIIGCQAKEAFHPHPNVAIYTDADRGHVQMKDAPLEIVDLR